MITEKVEKALIGQIEKEEFSSRLYLAMASWCQRNGYQGAADFLYQHSDEERFHMLKMVHYLNDRGGYAQLLDIKKPELKYKTLLDVFESVLEHEQYITKSINDLYEVCLTAKDYTTGSFLQWYINEQIEEESLVNSILDKMKLAGNDRSGLFHIDKELSGLSAAKDAGAAKE